MKPKHRLQNKRWRTIRRDFIMNNPLCVHCKEIGILTASREVDHIDWRDNENHNPKNLQALCKSCHSKKTYAEMQSRGIFQIKTQVPVDGYISHDEGGE